MRRVWLFVFPLLIAGCRPCLEPNICLPDTFVEGERVACGGNLCTWWEQFDDPLMTELIERALTCNHDLRLARERVLEARAIYQTRVARYLPQVNAETSIERIRNSQTLDRSPFLGATFVNLYRTGFDAFWELDLFGKLRDQAQAAAFEIAATAEEVRDVHVTIAAEVGTNYITLRGLQKQIQATEEHIAREEEIYKFVKMRFDGGLVSEVDVLLAKSLLEARRSDLPLLQTALKETIYALAVLLGRNPEELAYLFDTQGEIPRADGKIPLGLPTELLCQRGDVRRAEFAMRAAGAQVLAAKKELFPTVDLHALFGVSTGIFKLLTKEGSRSWSIAPTALLPIFQGGRIRANILAQTSLQHQAVLKYEQSILRALEEVETTLASYFYEQERIKALKEQIQADTQAQDIATIQYRGGLVDFLYVLIIERNLFFSTLSYIGSQEDQMNALIGIYKSLGGGWECSSTL